MPDQEAPAPALRTRRAVRFTFELTIPALADPAFVWLPRPVSDAWQRELGSVLPGGLAVAEGTDAATQNRTVRLSLPPSAEERRLEVSFDVERTLRREPAPPEEPFATPPATDPALARYLAPTSKVPLSGAIVDEARALAKVGDPPLLVARRAFEHLLATYGYDAGGCTPERFDTLGNLAAACDLKSGTCTELHGLFVSCLRVLGVPARFNFGFNLPREAREGRVKGYHCWALVALPGGAWLPVDVSEAWKRPELKSFFFGGLDADRVAFTFDRDVTLSPPQEGGPLDKFIFPYAEARGAALPIGLGFRFAEL